MLTIKLFCAAGMSTSVLVKKMKEEAQLRGIEVSIAAYPEADMSKYVDNMDVALLGPQVGYALEKAKRICEPNEIPVDVIPMVDYGMMNGKKVLDLALKLIKNK